MKSVWAYLKNLMKAVALAIIVVFVGVCGPATTRMVIQETGKEMKKKRKKK